MSRLRVFSGREVLKILGEFGFQDFAQRGSHIKLRRISSSGRTQTLTAPDHDEIRPRHASRHLPAGIAVHPGAPTSQQVLRGLRKSLLGSLAVPLDPQR